MTTRETTPFLPLRGEESWPADLKRRVSDRLFVAGWATIQWPWLLRSLSGGTKAQKRALLDRLELPHDALPNLGSWKADTGFLMLAIDAVERLRPASVVELGAGASSLIVGRALQRNGGGRLVSYDQHGGFVAATAAWLAEYGVEADLRVAPLGSPPPPWRGAWYRLDAVPATIDLLLIDGPPWTLHPFCRGAAETLFPRLSVGGTVLLDDGARPGERVVMARWRRRWPNMRFERVRGGTKGAVIGTRLA